MVNTPEQRRLRVKDSKALAWQDWLGSAQFDRPEDEWPRRVAEAYVDFAAGEMRRWLYAMGMRWWPVVAWAERGGAPAHNHGNSVPQFHMTWGAGPGIVEPFEKRVCAHVAKELVLSGSEQNLDFTSKDWRVVLRNRRGGKAPPSVQAFLEKGEDFITRDNLGDLVIAMNALTGDNRIKHEALRVQIE
jgi:predicted oxidoreductase